MLNGTSALEKKREEIQKQKQKRKGFLIKWSERYNDCLSIAT